MTYPFARKSRSRWSAWLIASLLFLQLASAAYACSVAPAGAMQASMAGMPCAQPVASGGPPALDAEQPGLCLEHCKGGSLIIEQGAAASLALPAGGVLIVVAAANRQPDETSAWRAWERERSSARPPPHAILHCCFRI